MEKYPTNTSLRRKLAGYIQAGGLHGIGLGILVLSEERLKAHGV